MEKEVWRRVAPTLNPWPGADAVGKALRDGAKADGIVLASDAARVPDTTPETDAVSVGAQPNPCCMGTEAETDIAVVAGFVEDEQAEKRQLQALARQAPIWARQTLWTLAAQASARSRRLVAAHYLITGETYSPAVCTEKIYVGKWLPALRERYHGAACTAMNYERAADGTPDPCLGDLFRELSADAFACAEVVARVLERALMG